MLSRLSGILLSVSLFICLLLSAEEILAAYGYKVAPEVSIGLTTAFMIWYVLDACLQAIFRR